MNHRLTAVNHPSSSQFVHEGSLLPIVNSSRFRKLFRKGVPYTDALRMTQAHLKREALKRQADPLKLCLNQNTIRKCFSPLLRFRPQHWPEEAQDKNWLIFNSIEFEQFFTDGDNDVSEPEERDEVERIKRRKKNQLPALIVPEVILKMSSEGACPMCLDIILDYKGPMMKIRDEYYSPADVPDETFETTSNMLACFDTCMKKWNIPFS